MAIQGPMSIGKNTFSFPNTKIFNPTPTQPAKVFYPGGGMTLAPTQSSSSTTQNRPGGVTPDGSYSVGYNGSGNGQSGYSGPSDEEINAMYAPVFQGYDNAISSLQGQQPTTEAAIRQAGVESKQPYDERQATGHQQLTEEQNSTNQERQNAFQLARQAYNEIGNQYNLARFGSGTSAGGAAMELLGRSTSQAFNSADQMATQNLQKIQSAWTQLDDFVSKQKANIDTQVNNKVLEAQQWFRDRINDINVAKAQTEADKAAKRYEALQQRQSMISDITNTAQQYGNQISSWADSTKQSLAQQAQQYGIAATPASNLQQLQAAFIQNIPKEMTPAAYASGGSTGGLQGAQYGGSGNNYSIFSPAAQQLFQSANPDIKKMLQQGNNITYSPTSGNGPISFSGY